MITKEDILPDIEIVSQKLNEMAQLFKKLSELQIELDQLGLTFDFEIVTKKDSVLNP
jgi:hypothetical protein